MKLFDADVLYDKVLNMGLFDNRDRDVFIDALDEQPISYDVNEVVEELEKYGDKFSSDNYDDWYAASIVSDCEEIVKRGGINV